MRLFVGLAPPPEVLDDLDAACGPFRPLRDDLRWTSREAWHITLAFLGEVTDPSLTLLVPRLERAAKHHPTLRLKLSGAGAFPSADRANVLWSGLSGDRRELAELAASVTAPPPDTRRRFRPHLTLARCRAPADVRPIVAGLEGYQGPQWTAEEIYLIRSRLEGHPRYETLGTWKLRPQPYHFTTGLASRGSGQPPARSHVPRESVLAAAAPARPRVDGVPDSPGRGPLPSP